MRILVALDSFKGSLDAAGACAAVTRGVARALPGVELDPCPLADGGEGTAAVVHSFLGGEWIEHEVTGPLAEERVRASYLWIGGPRPAALIDLAAASGLTLLQRSRLAPLRATTRGTGELVGFALERGAHRIWLALGGSATVDGGAGMATALGWRLLDSGGAALAPGGGELERLVRVVPPPVPLRAHVTALHDVDNPLLGERGAAAVFAPQKGASPGEVARLERGLATLAAAVERDLGIDLRRLRGGGAAGGAGAGAAAFLGARLVPGGATLLRLLRFDARLAGAALVITGEGRFDSQSLAGKVVSSVARAAARRGVPVAVVAGRVAIDEDTVRPLGIVALEPSAAAGVSDDRAMAEAAPLLEAAAERLARRWAAGS